MKKKQIPRRDEPLIDEDVFRQLHIMIVGLGRVGGEVCKRWLQYPVRKITGVDDDVINEKDVGSLFPRGIGERFKARLWQKHAEYWNPDIEFEGVLMRVCGETLARFADLLEDVDLLYWNADDSKGLTDVLRLTNQKPTIATLVGEDGSYAEVAWSLPGQTSCIGCALDAGHRVSKAGAPSLSIDVEVVANLAVRIGMGLVLAGRTGFELFQPYIDPMHSLLIVQNRANRYTRSSNPLVPSLIRLVPVDTSCDVCRRSKS